MDPIESRVQSCPLCDEPIQGPVCRRCDVNVALADIVECVECGGRSVKSRCDLKRAFPTGWVCPDCQ